MANSTSSYKVAGIKHIVNEIPSNFNTCLLCDIPIKPQKIDTKT